VSLYFYNPTPFLQAPITVIPASNGSSTMNLVGSADSLLTLGGHGTTFTVGVVDGTDTLKVGPIDINKNSFGTPFIYQNVATSGTLVLGSSRAATDIIEISDTAGNASVSVVLLNGNINMNSSGTSSVELTGEPSNDGSFIVQADNYQNISLTESSTVNSLVAGTAGLTANSLVFTVEPTSTSIVQSIASDGSLFLGSSQAASDIIELSDTAGVASVSVSLNNGTINMGSLPNTVELAGNPPPTGAFLIQNGANANISLTESSTVNSLVAGTAGLTANALTFTVGATATSIVQSIASDGSLFLGSSQAYPNTLEILDGSILESREPGIYVLGRLPGSTWAPLYLGGGASGNVGVICMDISQNSELYLGANYYHNNNIVLSDTLTTINTDVQIRNGYQLPNSLNISTTPTTTSIVQEVASGGTVSIGSSQLQPNTLQVGEAGLKGFVSIGGRGPGGNVFIAGGSGAGVICINTLSGNEALYLGANGYAPNWESIALTSGNMKVNVPLTVASTVAVNNWGPSGMTLNILTNTTLSQITSSGTSGSAGGQLNLGTEASGGNIVITDNLVTVNKQLNIDSAGTNTNPVTIKQYNSAISEITQGKASSGTIGIGSSQAYPSTISISDIYQNGSDNYIEIKGNSVTEANLFISGAQGDGQGCYMYPNIASGSQLNLGSSQTNARAVIITDTTVAINKPITGFTTSKNLSNASIPSGQYRPISGTYQPEHGLYYIGIWSTEPTMCVSCTAYYNGNWIGPTVGNPNFRIETFTTYLQLLNATGSASSAWQSYVVRLSGDIGFG